MTVRLVLERVRCERDDVALLDHVEYFTMPGSVSGFSARITATSMSDKNKLINTNGNFRLVGDCIARRSSSFAFQFRVFA